MSTKHRKGRAVIRLSGVAAVTALCAFGTPAVALATKHHKPHCHAGHVARLKGHRPHRHWACVRVQKAAKSKPVGATTLPKPGAPASVRAGLDPSFTQSPADNLKVTWSYSASAGATALPSGTLSLSVSEPNVAGPSGGCVMNVDAKTTGGTCTVELPQYGSWNVTVSYTGASTTVAPSSSTDTETIEPLPATVDYQWGTDQGTASPAVSATVIGSTANTVLSDASFEGASAVTLTDNLGDGCSATVSGDQATCQMPVTGTPSSYTVSYPGGPSTSGTRSVAPNGTQQVTYAWPADTVSVASPSVVVQQASVEECGGQESNITPNPWPSNIGCSYGKPTAWQNPVNLDSTTTLLLYAVAYGSLASDRDPTHGGGYVSGYLTYTVTGGTQGVDYTAADGQGSTPNNSADCSRVENQQYLGGDASNPANYGPDEPVGGCYLRFQTLGSYTVKVSFVSEDPNYASVAGPSITVTVG